MRKNSDTFYSKIISNLDRFATQDKMIEYLRQFEFHFIEMDVFLQDFPKFKFKVKDRTNSIMLRQLKPGVWDARMLVTFQLWGRRTNRVGIYLQHQFVRRIEKLWKNDQDINFKKLTITLKFPEAMRDYDERKKWRAEYKKVQRNPLYQPSEFYKKWDSQIIRLN